jgi:hypothetical protein
MTAILDKFDPEYLANPAVEGTDGHNIYVYPRRFVEVELDNNLLRLSVDDARALGQQLIAAADAVESGR